MKNESLRILGVMTGTSCDGIDMACIDMNANGWVPLWNSSSSYPPTLRKRVLMFQKPSSSHTAQSWLELHRDLGLWYGNAIQKKIENQKERPHVIANHGQTLAHFPKEGLTLQLGDGTRIATATGLTVVTHFREGDMAAAGQGAPLVPLFHHLIGKQINPGGSGIAFHNLGGISNLTYLGPRDQVLAFDTGPANIWIDEAIEQATKGKKKFDQYGQMALSGAVDDEAVARILKHPYFSKSPPKSTGRDQFSFDFFISQIQKGRSKKLKGNDLVATATAVTVESIVQAYKKWILNAGMPLRKIYFCGGGAKNLAILNGISSRLKGTEVSTVAEIGLNPQLIEPLAFAVFGYLSLLGQPIGGEWTGARHFGPPGQIIPGRNWAEVLSKI